MDISIFIAFSAGLLSFLSPCVFPLIPSYISLLIGDYAEGTNKSNKNAERKNILLPALIFVSGFTIVFILLGLSASFLGQFLLRNLSVLQKLSGIAVIVLGLHLSGIIKFDFLYREKNLNIKKSNNKFLRPLVMGFALALAWTPCIGPILSSILIYAGTSQTIIQGGILLAFYSIGFALPFILTALFLEWILPRFKKINPYLSTIQKIAGILLIILGIMIFTNYFQLLNFN